MNQELLKHETVHLDTSVGRFARVGDQYKPQGEPHFQLVLDGELLGSVQQTELIRASLRAELTKIDPHGAAVLAALGGETYRWHVDAQSGIQKLRGDVECVKQSARFKMAIEGLADALWDAFGRDRIRQAVVDMGVEVVRGSEEPLFGDMRRAAHQVTHAVYAPLSFTDIVMAAGFVRNSYADYEHMVIDDAKNGGWRPDRDLYYQWARDEIVVASGALADGLSREGYPATSALAGRIVETPVVRITGARRVPGLWLTICDKMEVVWPSGRVIALNRLVLDAWVMDIGVDMVIDGQEHTHGGAGFFVVKDTEVGLKFVKSDPYFRGFFTWYLNEFHHLEAFVETTGDGRHHFVHSNRLETHIGLTYVEALIPERLSEARLSIARREINATLLQIKELAGQIDGRLDDVYSTTTTGDGEFQAIEELVALIRRADTIQEPESPAEE